MSHEYSEKLCDLKKDLIDLVIAQTSEGFENVDVNELGEAIDMIKDISETEKNCAKARYYESVVEAMEEGSDTETHVAGMIESVKSIWADADYAHKQQIKSQLSSLLTEMV